MLIYPIPGTVRTQFVTPFDQHKARNGQSFKVISQLPDSEGNEEGESMFLIEFQDGTQIQAWGHEIQEHETFCECGCE